VKIITNVRSTQPRFLHSIFLHPNGEIKAMTADGLRLVLLDEFNMMLARPWPATPVNIHPVDIWSSFPNGLCDISGCLDRVLTTNANNLPPRREFYLNRIHGSWEHAAMVKATMQRLASIDLPGMGVSVAPILDLEGLPLQFHAHSNDVVMVLWPVGKVDYAGIDKALTKHMGVSIIEALMGPKMMSKWAWLGFRAQPLFDKICPTFERACIQDHPRNIIQVSQHVEIPHILARQTSRFSPWLFFDPLNGNPIGPRLMMQNHIIQNPVLLNIFSNGSVSSGNQLMLAYQHFGNMRTLMTTVLREELDMEMQWVRAMTNTKHDENLKAFNSANTEPPVSTSLTPMGCTFPDEPRGSLSRPVIVGRVEQTEPVRSSEAVASRGANVHFMLKNLPAEILQSIYKFLVKEIMLKSSIPSIRYAIPDFWWTSPKQLLLLSDEHWEVKTPIATITDGAGVLLPMYQNDVAAFFHGISFGFQHLFDVPFADWDISCFDYIPASSSFSLPGNLFVVRIKFSRSGYYLTIEPNRDVYKLHDLNDHDSTFGYFA